MFRRQPGTRASRTFLACWLLQLVAGPMSAGSGSRPSAAVPHPTLRIPRSGGLLVRSQVAPARPLRWVVEGMHPDAIYGVSLAFLHPAALTPAGGGETAELRLDGAGHAPIHKTFHAGDSEFYFNYQPRRAEPVVLTLTAAGKAGHPFRLEIHRLPVRPADFPAIEREPNDRWEDANRITLGRTVWAGADDADYLGPAKQIDTVAWPTEAETAGFDWYRFDYAGPQPTLAQFNIELLDRDVPVNVKVFRQERPGTAPAEYTEGKDPDEIRHDMQIELNYKHVTRVLRPGAYYVQVAGRHPFYQLKTNSSLDKRVGATG